MAVGYIGEIRMFAGNFAPAGWMLCQGQSVPISENDTLFQLLGTTYGGDGESTFNLPNLQGRLPVHQGTNPQNGITYQIGEAAGTESVTLNVNQIPNHTHIPASNTAGGADSPTNNVWGKSTTGKPYANAAGGTLVNMNTTNMVQPSGGSQPHDNMHPYLCINYIISLFGVYPSPN